MDNFQFWIYVIVAIIYLVSKVLRKSNSQTGKPAPRNRPQHTEEETDQLPPMTFEDLLREITEGKKKRAEMPPPSPVSPPPPAQKPDVPRYINYDELEEEEEESLERVDYDREREAATLQVYERAKRDVALKSSLESSLGSLQSSLGNLQATTPTSTVKREKRNLLLEEYIRELKSPSGFKKAVVMSEILKPKF